jgi:hypothetical protein
MSAADSGGPSDASDAASSVPSCWAITLSDTTHSATSNCLNIQGWNNAVSDPDSNTSVEVSYANGNVCFDGHIDSKGWGAVYSLTFANEQVWNAATRGVTGFDLEVSGPAPAPRVEVIYTSGSDFCRLVAPLTSVSVPFASTHPGCSTTASAVPNPETLTFLRLHWPIAASQYDFDFCLGLRARP